MRFESNSIEFEGFKTQAGSNSFTRLANSIIFVTPSCQIINL